jgi:hypothetical protein
MQVVVTIFSAAAGDAYRDWQRVYVHPIWAFSKPLYTLFEKWRKERFSRQNKVFSAVSGV